MKTLGIDFGLKRVGLALTDPGGIMAYPVAPIVRTTRDALFAELTELMAREDVGRVVVGLPLSMDGEDTETTRQARNFAASLERRVSVSVELVDERLSSVEASERMSDAGISKKRQKPTLDSRAAAIILETWLSTNRT